MACDSTFTPADLNGDTGLLIGSVGHINVTLNCSLPLLLRYLVSSGDTSVAGVADQSALRFDVLEPYREYTSSFSLRGVHLGRSVISFTPENNHTGPENNHTGLPNLHDYPMSVIRRPTQWDTIYLVVLGIMIVMYNFGFGCKIRLSELGKIIRKPVGPVVGAFCQFGLMAPVSAYVQKSADTFETLKKLDRA